MTRSPPASTTLGENRVQEADAKAPDVPGATWQLIGPLQSNKARRALEVFAAIQSVDSVALGERLDRLAREVRGAGPERRYPVLLQVNVDADPSKAGFAPADLEAAATRLVGLDALDVRGLMTIGRFVTDPEAARPTFAALRETSEDLRASSGLGPELSMGMTDDFEVAIEEGATIVRVGRALFGERPHHHARRRGRSHALTRRQPAMRAALGRHSRVIPSCGRLGAVGTAFLANFLQFLLMALWALIFGRMIMSWVDPNGRNRVSSFLFQATEPILAPVRRMLPQSGMIDWSGFIVLIILGFLWRAF